MMVDPYEPPGLCESSPRILLRTRIYRLSAAKAQRQIATNQTGTLGGARAQLDLTSG